jgi:hypothetical protein
MAAEDEMRMFHSDSDRREGLGSIAGRTGRLLAAWLHFCGWRLATIAGEVVSLKAARRRFLSRAGQPDLSTGRTRRRGRPEV